MKFSLRPKLSNRDPSISDQITVNYQSASEQLFLPIINKNLNPNENLIYYNNNGKQSKLNKHLSHVKQAEIIKEQSKQILESKPHNQHNYCEICDNIYGDYLRHINSIDHQCMFEKHFFNPQLLDFIQNFKKSQKKKKHTDQIDFEEYVTNKKFIHPFNETDHLKLPQDSNTNLVKNLLLNLTLSDKKINNQESICQLESIKISVTNSNKKKLIFYQINQNRSKPKQEIQSQDEQIENQKVQIIDDNKQKRNELWNQLQLSLDVFQISLKKEFQSRILNNK